MFVLGNCEHFLFAQATETDAIFKADHGRSTVGARNCRVHRQPPEDPFPVRPSEAGRSTCRNAPPTSLPIWATTSPRSAVPRSGNDPYRDSNLSARVY